MPWPIDRPVALLTGLKRGLLAWSRGAVAGAIEPAERTEPHTAEKAVCDQSPAAVPEGLRLRPEVEQPLLDAGMPPEGSSIYDSRKRAADTPEGAARKFVLWARAVGATGAYSARTISALYWECAEVDHREPVAIDRFLRALKTARGVRQEASPADRRRHVWIIDAAEPKPIPKARAADAKVAAKVPEVQPGILQRFAPEQDYASPQLLRATAHDARRQGRARKQRGSRNVRWAA
jgi:hypothetical protein